MKLAEHMERKRHGSPSFPVTHYHVDAQHPQYVMNAHWHKEFELIRVLEGAFTAYLNNEAYPLKAGELLLVEGGCLHRGEPADCIYECLVFDPTILLRQQNDAAERYILPVVNMQIRMNHFVCREEADILQTADALFALFREHGQYYELEVYSLMFRLFARLYQRSFLLPEKKPSLNPRANTVMELIDWIDHNYAEPMSLEVLAQRAGLSKKYLCRVFKEYTSKTLVDYINELRIEHACYELSARGKSITAAAYDSGFNDLSYFCKIFKRYKGMTPKAYKCSKPE